MATPTFTYFDCFSKTVLSRKFEAAMFMILRVTEEKHFNLVSNTAVVTSFGPRFHSKNDCHGVSHVDFKTKYLKN